ncbi:MAG: isoprenylcysteine carboxylmethyltransferase family protein [Pseudomonadota bacterium]
MSEEQPRGEKPLLIPPIWFLLFAGAQFLVAQSVPRLSVALPFATVIGIALGLVGLGFAVVALGLFRKARTTFHPEVPSKATALVTDGIYSVTRNPMYVGMALILSGIAVWSGSIIAVLLVLVFIGILTAVQIVPEERALERLFGNEYLIYKHRVPRWLFL